jgi:tetratricopeptide (TPR) repeat protein
MHISRTLVEFVLRGELPRRFLDDMEHEHLECLCPGCAEGLKMLAAGAEAAPGPRPDISLDPLEAVRRRLGLSLTQRQVQADEEEALEDLKRFFSRVPVSDRSITVKRAHKHYRGSLFGTLLLEQARRAIPDDPAESLSLAEAALISSERTHRKDPDPQVRVPALAVRGNAKRALGRLREADADLQEARQFLDTSGLDDLLIAAELDFYLGSLRKDQSRLEEALRHLERAAALYTLVGDLEKTAATFLKLGIVHHRLQRFDAAIATTEEAMELLGGEAPDWLRAYARFNLALFLHGLGDVEQAQRELDAHHELIASAGEGLAFRAGWLRARIAWSREDLGKAERLFRETYRTAVDRGIPFDTGLVSLELALVHLVKGRTSQVKKLATEALETFAAQDVDRECRAALDLLAVAARRDSITRKILEQAIAVLERAGQDRQPGARA